MLSAIPIFSTIKDWATFRINIHGEVGFVPTMGALHSGHASLLEKSSRDCAHTIVSIFVNPTQFNDPNDFKNYPKTFEQDCELAKKSGATAIFAPRPEEIYADKYRFQVSENEISRSMEGLQRPGHFNGVLTVVLKLLQIVKCDRAYFGEKDYQQFLLVKEMAEAFFLPTEIIACPTLRESDGLAMSSRNVRLTAEQRKLAPNLYRLLNSNASDDQVKLELEALGFKVEYVCAQYGRRFAAANLGITRLIDNVSL